MSGPNILPMEMGEAARFHESQQAAETAAGGMAAAREDYPEKPQPTIKRPCPAYLQDRGAQTLNNPWEVSEGSQALRLYIENRRAPLGQLNGAKPLRGDFRAFPSGKASLHERMVGRTTCRCTREALAPTSESKCLHLPSIASAGLVPVMAE